MISGHVMIFGAGGIGSALALLCCQQDGVEKVTLVWRTHKPDIDHSRLHLQQADVMDAERLASLFATGLPNVVVSTIGMLHQGEQGPEKRLAQFDPDWFLQSQAVNAAAALVIARMIDIHSNRRDSVLLAALSARVGSISDNRSGGWYSYRSSKAALNMAMKTVALEWQRSRPRHCVLLLHPGTVDTALSQPFQVSVSPEKLFSPAYAAQQLLAVLAQAGPEQSGQFLAWDGRVIDW